MVEWNELFKENLERELAHEQRVFKTRTAKLDKEILGHQLKIKVFRERKDLTKTESNDPSEDTSQKAKYDTLITLEESKINILNQKKQRLELDYTKKRNEIMSKIKRAEEIILQKRNEMKYQLSSKLRT